MVLLNEGLNAKTSFVPVLKTIARTVLPIGVRRALLQAADITDDWKMTLRLNRLRRRLYSRLPASNETERLLDYTVRINTGPNFFTIYKDIFVKRIYHFEARRPDPLILDCGSNIGGAILYFKHVYPQARIIGFEPDPIIFPYLRDNIVSNGLTDVQLVQAALAEQEGLCTFYSDGNCGSRLENLPRSTTQEWTRHDVPRVRLHNYLTEPIDFLKMNIEGAEWEVLADSEDLLPLVHEMVIEYHHFRRHPKSLHRILDLLDRRGFEYLISDFDYETNPDTRPPFRVLSETFYLLIYAIQTGQSLR